MLAEITTGNVIIDKTFHIVTFHDDDDNDDDYLLFFNILFE